MKTKICLCQPVNCLLPYERSMMFHSHNFFIAGLVSIPLGRINKFHSQ